MNKLCRTGVVLNPKMCNQTSKSQPSPHKPNHLQRHRSQSAMWHSAKATFQRTSTSGLTIIQLVIEHEKKSHAMADLAKLWAYPNHPCVFSGARNRITLQDQRMMTLPLLTVEVSPGGQHGRDSSRLLSVVFHSKMGPRSSTRSKMLWNLST